MSALGAKADISPRSSRREWAGYKLTYDALNRMTAKHLPSTEGDVSYSYDNRGLQTAVLFTAASTGITTTYDGLNRQLDIVEDSSSAALHTSGYNDQGQMITATRLTGVESSYGYDPAGGVSSIGLALAGTTHDGAFGFSYTPASQISYPHHQQ